MVNIFVSYYTSPKKSAMALDDKRVGRLAFESAEILSGAILNVRHGIEKQTPDYKGKSFLERHGEVPPYLPKLARRKHPCILWASKSWGNYLWLLEHFKWLAEEHKLRYGHTEYCKPFQYYEWLHSHMAEIPQGSLTPFHEAMPDEIKSLSYITQSKYRLCLLHKHLYLDQRDSTWSKHGYVKRSPPAWMFDPRGREILRDLFGKPVNDPPALRMT